MFNPLFVSLRHDTNWYTFELFSGILLSYHLQKDQSGGLLVHLVACDGTQLKIEFLNGIGIHENLCAVLVVGKVHFDIVREQALPHFANNERLANLSRAINDEHFVGIACQIAFNILLYLAFQHVAVFFMPQRYAFLIKNK